MDANAGFVSDIPAGIEENLCDDALWDISSFNLPMSGGGNLHDAGNFDSRTLSITRPQYQLHENLLYDYAWLDNGQEPVRIDQRGKRKYASAVQDEQIKRVCRSDLRQNHLWTPVLELDTLRDYHFGTVLPRLQSLVPHRTSKSCLPLPNLGTIDNDYSRAYLRLLVIAMSNNLAGIGDLPAHSIFDYIETRFNTKQIGAYLTSLNKAASRAFIEGLLRCAICAGNAGVIDFVLSHPECSTGADDIVFLPHCDGQKLWKLVANLRDISAARVLLKHGANAKRMLKHAALKDNFRLTQNDLDFISMLLDAGARVNANTLLSILGNLPHQDSDLRIIQRLLLCCRPDSLSREDRSDILLIAMENLPEEYCLEFAEVLIQTEAQVGDGCPGVLSRRCNMNLKTPDYIIDASASRGHQQLVQKFLEEGAYPTKYTLMHAVESGNLDLVAYLINEAKILNKKKPSKVLIEAISEIDSVDMIAVLERHNVFPEACRERRCFLEIYRELQAGLASNMKILISSLHQHRRDSQETPEERESRLGDALGRFLVDAIELGREDMARILIDEGASFVPQLGMDSHGTEEDHEARPALLAAVRTRNVGIIRALLDAGADPDQDSVLSGSALSLAIEWGEISIVHALVLAGADVNAVSYAGSHTRPKQCTPLALAVKLKNSELAQYLLGVGADPDRGAKRDNFILTHRQYIPTPLQAAVKNNDRAMIELLFAYGCDRADSEALDAAVEDENMEIVELLLQYFAQRYPHGKAQYGSRAIRNAILRGGIAVVNLMIGGNVDIRCMQRHDGGMGFPESPSAIALNTDRSAGQEILRLFLRSGLDPNDVVAYLDDPSSPEQAENHPRYTALLYAIQANNHYAISALIEFGADVNLKPKAGIRRTPLQSASEMGSLRVVELLLKEGAYVNELPASRGGATALQLAAIGGYVGVAELLLENGADVNGPTAIVRGRSAIDGAAEHGRFHMVEYLLSWGAELRPHPGYEDCQAIRLAKKHGHLAVVELIREHLNDLQTLESLSQSHSVFLPASFDGRPICQHCGDSFKNRSSLARHIRTKHTSSIPDADPEHKCTFCAMTFKRKDMLTRHLSTHTNAMRTSCETCGKEFSRKDYLKAQHLDEQGRCKASSLVPESNS